MRAKGQGYQEVGRDDHVALLHSLTVVYADSTSATWSNQLPFVISARLQSTRVRAHMVQLLASASSYRHRRVHTAQAVPQDRLLRVVRHPLARRSCPITRRTTQPCPTTACAIQPRQVALAMLCCAMPDGSSRADGKKINPTVQNAVQAAAGNRGI